MQNISYLSLHLQRGLYYFQFQWNLGMFGYFHYPYHLLVIPLTEIGMVIRNCYQVAWSERRFIIVTKNVVNNGSWFCCYTSWTSDMWKKLFWIHLIISKKPEILLSFLYFSKSALKSLRTTTVLFSLERVSKRFERK